MSVASIEKTELETRKESIRQPSLDNRNRGKLNPSQSLAAKFNVVEDEKFNVISDGKVLETQTWKSQTQS